MSELNVLPASDARAAAKDDPMAREATVSIKFCSPTPGRIGAVLDEVLPLLQEIVRTLADPAVSAEVLAPGWHETFYGLESDEDDPA
jgi:hypothetical protein